MPKTWATPTFTSLASWSTCTAEQPSTSPSSKGSERFGPLLWDLRTTEEIPGFGDRELSPSYIPLWSIFSDPDSYAASLSDVPPARKKKQAVALYDAVADQIVRHFHAREVAA